LSINNFSQLKIATSLVKLLSSNQEESQGEGLLGTINVDLWHVHVINEDNHPFTSTLWAVLFECLFVDVLLDDLLEVH